MADCLFEEFKNQISKIKGKIKVAITHGDNLSQAEKLKKMIEKVEGCEIAFLNLIGNILGGLAGPGALVLAWQYD